LLYHKSTSNLQCKKQGDSFLEYAPAKKLQQITFGLLWVEVLTNK